MKEIPVLFLTGLVETGDRVEGFEAGGVDYIVKPYHSREILVRIRTHLERARLAGILLEKNRELERLRRELDWTNQVLQEEIIRALNPDL